MQLLRLATSTSPSAPDDAASAAVRYAKRTSGGYRIAARRLPAQRLHIDSTFLAATLRHYSSHPRRSPQHRD
jgi:hypothetical protein